MEKTIQERVSEHVASFKVGETINAMVFPATEIDGVILSIDGHMAQIQTIHGKLFAPLSLAKHTVKQTKQLESKTKQTQ